MAIIVSDKNLPGLRPCELDPLDKDDSAVSHTNREIYTLQRRIAKSC